MNIFRALLVLLLCSPAPALATPFEISKASIVYTSGQPLDSILAHLLAKDIQLVTGHLPDVYTDAKKARGNAIIIMQDARHLKGQWECYSLEVVNNRLIISGSDARGTAYGVFAVSEKIGVSPWYWWADVKPAHKPNLTIDIKPFISKPPSVKYRGIFLNDEDWGLQPWAAKTFEPEVGNIGPKTYAKIFELLLRLKANLIWPAMHPGTKPFFTIPGNKEMAAAWQIIIGTSHAEPMLRNNVGEWDEKSMGRFNYLTNKQQVLGYWQQRVEASKSTPAIYTLGMRGVHDSGMEGIKDAGEAAPLLEQIFTDQRALLQQYVSKDITTVPQAFTAYKEVLEIYDKNLKVPADVTIVWPDDNYGYIQRLNDEAEKRRAGGSGVYYHISYWGRPHDYLWLGSTHPGLIRSEMMKAWENGSNRLWVVNVGDIKPLEYLTQLFLDMAYNVEPFKDSRYTKRHLANWFAGIFGKQADAIQGVLWRYYQLAFERRPEFMGWSQTEPTTKTNYTAYNSDEAQRRLAAYDSLETIVKHLRRTVAAKDAFYELVYYPVVCASLMNKKFLYRDKADLAASKKAYTDIQTETNYYNNTLAGGKWKHMMSMKPRDLPVFSEPVIPEGTTNARNIEQPGSYVSIRAVNCDKNTQWKHLHDLEMMQSPNDSGAYMAFTFYSSADTQAVVNIFTLPTHPINKSHGMRYAVSIDDGPLTTLDFKTVGRSEEWKQNVLRNSAIRTATLQKINKGKHVLKIYSIDPGVIVDRIEIDLGGLKPHYSALPGTK